MARHTINGKVVAMQFKENLKARGLSTGVCIHSILLSNVEYFKHPRRKRFYPPLTFKLDNRCVARYDRKEAAQWIDSTIELLLRNKMAFKSK